jgi:hypothetical protein
LNGYQLKKTVFTPAFVSTAQRFSSSINNPQKDTFHKLICGIDRVVPGGIIYLKIAKVFPFQTGPVLQI